MKTLRKYTDVNGISRTLELLESDVRLINWSKNHPMSTVHCWKLDDSSVVYIPENVWEVMGIKYEDINVPDFFRL